MFRPIEMGKASVHAYYFETEGVLRRRPDNEGNLVGLRHYTGMWNKDKLRMFQGRNSMAVGERRVEGLGRENSQNTRIGGIEEMSS